MGQVDLSALLACDPSLAGREIAVIGGGESNTVVQVGTEHVFRFPRNSEALARLRAEAALLSKIAEGAPLPVPAPTHLATEAPLGRAFMGYRALRGQPLLRGIWFEFTTQQQARVADALGRFLAWLHALSQEVIGGVELPCVGGPAYWQQIHARFEQKLAPHMHRAGRERLSAQYRSFLAGPGAADVPACLVHGDFGPSNILYDSGLGMVSGIIDFGSCGWGDPAVDIAGLVGPVGYAGVEKMMAQAYPGVEGLLPRARYYASTFALQEALYAQEQGDAALFARCMEGYR